jgi:hypothetical protein
MQKEMVMRKFMQGMTMPALAVAAIAAMATPALAADVYARPPAPRAAVLVPAGPLTLQDALAVAANIGVVTVNDTHFDDDEWQIKGRDAYGKWIEVDVDSRTGEVRNVDRSIL